MKKTDVIRIFHVIDENIWSEKTEANPLLSTLIVFSIAILGACVSGGKTLNEWFHWNIGISLYAAAATSVIIFGFLLAECIITAKTLTVSITRSLFYFGVCLVAFWAGYLLALLILFAIAIYLVITIMLSAFDVMTDDMLHPSDNSSSSSTQYTTVDEVKLEDGTTLTRKENDDWRDEYGQAWDKKNDHFEKR